MILKWPERNAETFSRLLELQSNTCAICHDELKERVVDYNHKTKEIRGVLCRPCSSWLDHQFDKYDEKFLRAALRYILNPPARSLEPPTSGQKRCARCNLVKPLDEFYHYRGRATSYCRPCRSDYQKKRTAKKRKSLRNK